MKILFHHRIGSRDGQAVHMEELIAALTALGHTTILVGPSGLTETEFGSSNRVVDWVKQALPAAMFELLEIAYSLRAFVRLRAAIKLHQPDVIYERFSLFLFAGVWVHRLSGLPLLLEVNSPLYEERASNDGLKLHALGRWSQRMLWNAANYVLPVTQVLARSIAEYGVPVSRITVVPNGINPARFGTVVNTTAAKHALGLKGIVLGFTGFIRRWNSVHRIIDFVAGPGANLDLHVLVVGDGPARDSLLAHAAARGVSRRLTITGVVERDDVVRYVAAFDVALIPGLTVYWSPLKLFEYMNLRRAVVAPDTENIREIITDSYDGLLIEPNRDGSMGGAVLRLCNDEELRQRLGDQAHHTTVARSLTWSHNAERVVELAQTAIRADAAKRFVGTSCPQ